MKNHIYIAQLLFTALLLIFTGCAKNQEQVKGTDLSQIKTEIPARQFIESKEFITQDDLKSVDISKISDEEGAKIKAALYRFYSNVNGFDNESVYYNDLIKFIIHVQNVLIRVSDRALELQPLDYEEILIHIKDLHYEKEKFSNLVNYMEY